MGQADLVLLFGAFDDFVHGVQTVLDLFHESTFPLKSLLFISFKLVNQAHKLLLQSFFRVLHVFMSLMYLFIYLPLYVGEKISQNESAIILPFTTSFDKSRSFFVHLLHELALLVALLLDTLHDIEFKLSHLVTSANLSSVSLCLSCFPLLPLILELISQKLDLSLIVEAALLIRVVWPLSNDTYCLQSLKHLAMYLDLFDC